ncbi:MAG: tail fiber domain-containing protein [Candidatus Korobacteraceae bacterium]|jgi:hypothetical protein
MYRFSTSLAIMLFVLILVSLGFAQQTSTTTIPNLIRYSGTLKDAQGATFSSTATGVTFAIYKQQDGGAPVWMETQTVTPDASGNYSVLLGSTTAAGLPADLFSQEEQRWLGVQVEGQAEQPRVLLVSVPYALKAHEAETLAGKSISDFVLANGASSAINGNNAGEASPSSVNVLQNNGTRTGAASDGPTNFSGSTSDQIVGVTQTGSGAGVSATSPNNAVVGTATANYGDALFGTATGNYGYALYGVATGVGSIGVKGASTTTSGTGIRGIETATTGATTGISSYVASPTGIAAVFNNAGGGKIVSAQDNGVEKFSVDGSGNVNIAGGFTGSGAGLTGIPFANLSGTLASSQLSGIYSNVLTLSNGSNSFSGSFTGSGAGLTGISFSNLSGTLANAQFSGGYSNAVTLSNTSNVYYGNGSNLTGVVAGPGSPYYIQNGTLQQFNANFYIGGSGTANSFNAATTYQIANGTVLSIGSPSDDNLFVGIGAGTDNTNGQGTLNMFSGFQAGYGNTFGYENTFSGSQAGYGNTFGHGNTISGYQAGYQNALASANTFSGYQAGYNNTGDGNTFFGNQAGYFNTTGTGDVYIAYAGVAPGSESNAIRIGTVGAQSAAFIAGIYGSTSSSGVPVYINSTGHLGTVTSSLRFKEQIHDMGDSTKALMKLRPVTFLYKPEYDEGDHTLQYGLIAEEVAQVYPELVAYGNDGQPYTVRYQYLASMLLNEVQKQYRRAEAEASVIQTQQEQIRTQDARIGDLEQRLLRLESLVGTPMKAAEAHEGAASPGEAQ